MIAEVFYTGDIMYIKPKNFDLVKNALQNFCDEEGLSKIDYKPILTAFKTGRTNRLRGYHWFLLIDAMNAEIEDNKIDEELAAIYEIAMKNWQDSIKQNA